MRNNDTIKAYQQKMMEALKANGFMDEEGVTARGIAALEPYRVKRAVLLAAGFGSRLLPVTVNTPKPHPRTASETSCSSSPKRVSGLSEPKRAIASA